MLPERETQRLRESQDGIRALVERDLRAIYATLDLYTPERARDELTQLTLQLVAAYGRIGADVAADWYDVVRADQQIPGRFRAQAVIPDETEAITRTVRRAAAALFSPNPEAVLTSLAGPAGKYALSGSRTTIVQSTLADPQASGWARVTRGGACGFCKMLAQRGAVYRRETVQFSSHTHCNCAAVPSWDPDAPEVDVRAYRASERTSTMSPAALQAHRARVRDYIAAFGD